MSRGLGKVQLSLIAALEAQPNRHFTVIELAQAAFPGVAIKRKHEVSVRRALGKLPETKLHSLRGGKSGSRGWRLFVRHRDKCCFLCR
jgi:hypothetical protein